jgi:hypothetical protein
MKIIRVMIIASIRGTKYWKKMDKKEKFDLGKPTKRGVKKCPSCGMFNGTRGAKCKNKKCNVILRRDNRANRLDVNLRQYQTNSNHFDSIRIVTDNCLLALYSVNMRDRDIGYREFVDLSPNGSNPKCFNETCPKYCCHIQLSMECKKNAQPLHLKASSLNLLDLDMDMKNNIMSLACQTPAPLVFNIFQ